MRRAGFMLLAVLTLAAAWCGPVARVAPGPFSGHMIMHMAVVAVAAPLIALALVGGRIDPVRRAPGLFAPIPASLVELVVVWAWHTPAMHHVARHGRAGLVVEQATFLASGLIIWLAVLGGDARQRRTRAAAGVVALLLTSMHMTLLGALLALPPRPLYAHAEVGGWLTAIEDQQLGGAIMLAVGGLVYLIGGLALAWTLLRRTLVDGHPQIGRA